MDVVGVDDFAQGASNVPYLGDARLVNGALTNSTFLENLFSKVGQGVVVYHLLDPSGVAAALGPPSHVYTSNLVRSAADEHAAHGQACCQPF
jgi:hypothetical protein